MRTPAVAGVVATLSSLLSSCCGGAGTPASIPPPTPIVNPTHCDPAVSAPCHAIGVGGVSRTYWLHVPSSFEPDRSGLVIALHGGGGSGETMERDTGLSATADAHGFAVVYPDGVLDLASPPGLFWYFYWDEFWWTTAPDDVPFLRALIASLQRTLRFDSRRVYVTGFSAGAMMSHRVGVEMSDVVAAVAPVEGWLYSVDTADARRVPRAGGPVSVLILQGDQDLFCGGRVTGFRPGATLLYASQDEAFDYWAASNRCRDVDTRSLCSDAVGPTSVFAKAATACDDGTEVRVYRLAGGSHRWYADPMNVNGQAPFNPAFDASTGVTTNEILWTFFAAHPRR